MQCATQGLGEDFWLVYNALREEFLVALFLIMEAHIMVQTITVFLIKHTDILIPDPTLTSHGNWTALCVVTWPLVSDQRGRIDLRYGDYVQLLSNGRKEI